MEEREAEHERGTGEPRARERSWSSRIPLIAFAAVGVALVVMSKVNVARRLWRGGAASVSSTARTGSSSR